MSLLSILRKAFTSPLDARRDPSLRVQGSMHAFDAARHFGYRGWFWFPSLDPGQQSTTFTREEIGRKSNWAYNNIGAARAVIDGLSLDEVDTGLWPKPRTSSPAFNAAVKALWDQQCGFGKACTSDGENNFYAAQFLQRREIRLRGDVFAQKLRSGEAAACPQIHFLPGWQCRNNPDADPEVWHDGRRDAALGRAVAFRFVTGRSFRDVPADQLAFLHDPFLIGQKRGLPCLAPVVRKLFSLDDIERAETSGVLLRSRIAYAIERKMGDDDPGPTLLPGTVDTQQIEQEDGSKLFVQKVVAQDGTEVDVAEMRGGRQLKVIESSRASESGDWLKLLLADIAYSTLYPVDYIYSLGGLTQGTLVRMVQQKIQRVLNTVRDFQLIPQFIDDWYPFWLWDNIAAGNLDNVRGGIPDDWWPYVIIRPRDMSVDPKGDGRLYDERVATGKMPVGLYVGMLYGADEEEHDDAVIRDAYRRRRRNREIAAELQEDPIPVEEIFRAPAGGPSVPAEPEQKEDDDPPKKGKS